MTDTAAPTARAPAPALPRPFDVEAVRARFPSLRREVDGRTVAYLDGPAGTQVPDACIDAIASYLQTCSANHGGAFPTSRESDKLVADAHAAAADFLGASDPAEVAFGANMTTLTFAASRAIGRTLRPGDEIVVTRLDHDANVAPWLALQEERGATVRWVGIRPDDCTLDMEELVRAVGPRTRVVAVGLASNAVGTINPVRQIAEVAHAAGAWLWVDAVHAAPHVPIDVAALDADFLVCSGYKFYGPHVGLLWGRRTLLEGLPAYKVRPAADELPSRFETGTGAFELIAGLAGTFDYLEWLGVTAGRAGTAGGAAGSADTATSAAPGATDGGRAAGEGAETATSAADGGRAGRLRAAMEASRAYERGLVLELIAKVGTVPGVRIRGIVDPARIDERCPTIAFTMDGHDPHEIAAFLGRRAICVWDGDYYAYELIRSLGLAESGGMVRVGLVHYSTSAEIDRLVEALEELARTR